MILILAFFHLPKAFIYVINLKSFNGHVVLTYARPSLFHD